MDIPKLFASEYKFACIVWAHEPLTTRALVDLCADSLGWKRTTTYTQLKRLTQRGVLRAEDSVVTSLIPKQAVQQKESADFVERTFDGSVPAFLATFLNGRKLTAQEAEQLRRMIEEAEE